jgi:elongation factor P
VIVATQLKVGMVIMHNGKPHRVTNVLHVTPGNWRGMVQTRMVNIESGSNAEQRFRSEDKLERAHMEEHSLQFSYRAGDDYHFMNTESYEMVALSSEVLGDAVNYMIEGMQLTMMCLEGLGGRRGPDVRQALVRGTTADAKSGVPRN